MGVSSQKSRDPKSSSSSMGCISSTPQAVAQPPAKPMPVAPKASVELRPVEQQPKQAATYDRVPTEEPPSSQAGSPPVQTEENLKPNDTFSTVEPTLVVEKPSTCDELLLDFETFLLLPDVQAVLLNNAVGKSILLELFQIVDKNMDGYVNDNEREDLLELISLSYGKKSSPVPQDDKVPAQSGTEEANSPAQDSGLPTPPSNADAPAPPAEAVPASTSTGGMKGRAKPKIIRFVAPTLVDPAAPAAPKPAESSSTKSTVSTEERSPSRESPAQKKGFMLAKRESFDKTEVISASQSRFFVLENGCLSYMDSTSKKPPFSLNHREINLAGVDIRVTDNTIELTPLRGMGQQGGSEKDDAGEIVVLELKSAAECAEWMWAIQEHLEFSKAAD